MKYVLFVCTHNAGRSQIAQAFFERYAPEDVRAESAGQEPADAVWPEVVEAMNEVGIDLSGRRPKKIDLEMQLHADWAITLACGGTCPYVPGIVEDWDIPDPHGRPTRRSPSHPRRTRATRTRPDREPPRRDPHRPHRPRPTPRTTPPLPRQEFEDSRTPEEIRVCADAILARYDDAPVRSFLLTLADRADTRMLARRQLLRSHQLITPQP